MSHLITLGIDISKDKLDVVLYRAEQYAQASFANSHDGYRRLARWLKKRRAQGSHVCIEATGGYGEGVAHYLHQRGYPVSLVNPARIKAYANSRLQRNKTDREDARLIAHFCATQHPSLWSPPPPEVQELRALTKYLESLKADRAAELNRQQSGVTAPVVLQAMDTHIQFLNTQIAELQQRIRDLIDQHPPLRRQHELLTSIPGFGDTTAAAFIAQVPDVSRFESAGQLAAFAGLTPRQHHSGASVHRPSRLSKTGSTRFRTIFFFPAMSARRCNPIVQALVQRLRARGKKPMVIIGAVMRKLVHLAYGVLKNDTPFDPNYLINVQDAV